MPVTNARGRELASKAFFAEIEAAEQPLLTEPTYYDAKSIPQRGAERLELRWGSPRQYRSHRGG